MMFTKEVQELARVTAHVYHATPPSGRRRIRKFPLPEPPRSPSVSKKRKRSRGGRRLLLRTRTMAATIKEGTTIVDPQCVLGPTRSHWEVDSLAGRRVGEDGQEQFKVVWKGWVPQDSAEEERECWVNGDHIHGMDKEKEAFLAV